VRGLKGQVLYFLKAAKAVQLWFIHKLSAEAVGTVASNFSP